MDFKELLKDELNNIEKNKDSDILLKNLQEGELESLKKIIEDIHELIKKRQELHQNLVDEIRELSTSTRNFVSSLPVVSNEDVVKLQLELRKKLVDIEELKLQEKLNEWRDIAELKKELREKVKEYQEKTMRGDIIDQLLD